MSTTSAYGWNIPDNTDLVKDGALAIRTLGNAIDTSMNTALGTKKAGMVLLNTTSFSGVTSQSVNDVFSATYRNYRIQIGIVNKNSQGFIQMRLRVSGADDTNSAYNNYGIGFDNSGATRNNNLNGQTTWRIGEGNTGSTKASTNIDLFYPNESYTTRGLLQYMGESGSGTPYDISMSSLMSFNNATVFTGFTIISSAGTITGDVSVFGVNK